MTGRRGPLRLIDWNDGERAAEPEIVLKSLRSALGMRFRKARQARKLSFDQLASVCGVSSGMISKWERGMGWPKPDQLRRLKEALGVSGHFLAMGSHEEEAALNAEIQAEIDAMTPAIAPGSFLTAQQATARETALAVARADRARQKARVRESQVAARVAASARILEERLAARENAAKLAKARRVEARSAAASKSVAMPVALCRTCRQARTGLFYGMCPECWSAD